MTQNTAPKHLSREAKMIWRKINTERELYDCDLVVLKVALEAYDRLMDARRIIDSEGVYYSTDTGFKREHPCLKIEKEARSGFLQAWRMLNLNIEVPGDIGRPPGS